MNIAMVTGAGGGLGKAICQDLSDKGWGIIAIDRQSIDELQQTLLPIKQNIVQCVGSVDFTDKQKIIQVLTQIFSHKSITVLVNNAGVSVGGKMIETELEDWEIMMSVNLTAPFLFSQAFIKNCQEKNITGSIINISSLAGLVGAKKPGYGASKAGLIGLTKSIAMQVGPTIRCNAICPGAMETNMIADWDENTRLTIIKKTPIGRIASSSEIAKIVSFLASSNESGYLTGSVINATGGQYLG